MGYSKVFFEFDRNLGLMNHTIAFNILKTLSNNIDLHLYQIMIIIRSWCYFDQIWQLHYLVSKIQIQRTELLEKVALRSDDNAFFPLRGVIFGILAVLVPKL